MTDKVETVGLISLLVTLWILLPLIPAVLLYRLFPDTRVTASGVVNNWKIKATGAFGGYLAIFAPGYMAINQGIAMAKAPATCVWRMSAEVKLTDLEGKPIPATQLPPIKVALEPDVIKSRGQFVDVDIPSNGTDIPSSTITIEVPQFGREVINLKRPASNHQFTLNGREIVFTKPIVISQLGEGRAYDATKALQPLP